MKKNYEKPIVSVLVLDETDVIRTSGVVPDENETELLYDPALNEQ